MPVDPHTPSPALVTQAAVARLPRWALVSLCLIYMVAGYVGRQPWKGADITAFGYMRSLYLSESSWLSPQILGVKPELDAYLAYWLGAGSIGLFGSWMDWSMAARIPFLLMLGLTFYTAWYAIYHLARSPLAQPVAFAFGGEAQPVDYARAVADAGLLALIASLGLPLIAHEASPAVLQLGLSTLMLYAVAAMNTRTAGPAIALVVAAEGLVLSGSPILAVCWCLAGAALHTSVGTDKNRRWAAVLLAVAVASAVMAWGWDAWHWRADFPQNAQHWKESAKLLFWFTWPSLPLAAWALWRWRRQWLNLKPSFHLAWPLLFTLICWVGTLAHQNAQRSLLLCLPALAALAAFALPTLKRSIAALVDWFTLLFFTGCAIVIWVVWLSMQTGIPAQPARNVARLAPGFVHQFEPLLLVLALLATLAWLWLVHWRVGKNRSALWKSLVLPAGGATLSWVLLMTLWLPMLDYARSYRALVTRVEQTVPRAECVLEYGLNPAKITALQHHGRYRVYRLDSAAPCMYVVVDREARIAFDALNLLGHWAHVKTLYRTNDNSEGVLIYRRSRQ
jgi:4-amino-4-deoxy-L-arabinose transferase-like glycosyltransferase